MRIVLTQPERTKFRIGPSSDLYRSLLVASGLAVFSRRQQSCRIQNEGQLGCDVNKRCEQRVQ